MAEETYEYECMRAELLGTQRPSLEEYLNKNVNEHLDDISDQEHLDIENLKKLENEGEGIKNISGGLHELSSILSNTQKKINKFKVSCASSLTNLLKIKVGFGGSSDSIISNVDKYPQQDSNVIKMQETSISIENNESTHPLQSDATKTLDNHVDVLDRLIDKAENCQYSMQQQNKAMKKFLR